MYIFDIYIFVNINTFMYKCIYIYNTYVYMNMADSHLQACRHIRKSAPFSLTARAEPSRPGTNQALCPCAA